jgi:DegT/DnrJ/EryC1/StrS aminotransferase family
VHCRHLPAEFGLPTHQDRGQRVHHRPAGRCDGGSAKGGGLVTAVQPPEVLFADPFNRPQFNMGPYDNAAMARNFEIAASPTAAETDWKRFFGGVGSLLLTRNGREAICLALADLGLVGDDEVLIETTSGSRYVSRCVTDSIEQYCCWSRRLGGRTRAVLLIHEFGFPARLSSAAAAAGLPVIEDCAYALGSQNAEGTLGAIGDYVVYSLSKALPLPFGGVLKPQRPVGGASALSGQARRDLPRLLAHYLPGLEAACRRRRELFETYRAGFAAAGLSPLFEPGAAAVPHAFVVALPDQKRAEAIKPRLRAAGVISSVFYGGGGYFLPNHQSLSPAAIDYIIAHFIAALAAL